MMIYLPYDDDDDDDDDDLPAMTSFLQSANRLQNQTFLPPVHHHHCHHFAGVLILRM